MKFVTLTFGEYTTIQGASRTVEISVTGPKITDLTTGDVFDPHAVTWGKSRWDIKLPATDDNNITPRGFTYEITVDGKVKHISLPYDVANVDYDSLTGEETSQGIIYYPARTMGLPGEASPEFLAGVRDLKKSTVTVAGYTDAAVAAAGESFSSAQSAQSAEANTIAARDVALAQVELFEAPAKAVLDDIMGGDVADLVNKVLPVIMINGPGIDYTGATDSTTAMQSIINAAPNGSVIGIGPGVLKISTLTVSGGKRLQGVGYYLSRDAFSAFGEALWANDSLFGGSRIRSTATTGAAITVANSNVAGGGVAGFYIIGPGSGSSVGIALGSATTTQALIDPTVDVGIGNFSLGMRTRNLNEGSIKLVARGCTQGASFEQGSNNVSIHLNAQCCVTGAETSVDTLGTTFYSPILQANTGTGLKIRGTSVVVINPYCESLAGEVAIDVVSGSRNAVIAPSLNTPPDVIRIRPEASWTHVTGIDPARLRDLSTTTTVDTDPAVKFIGGTEGVSGNFTGTVDTGATFTTSTEHRLVVGQELFFDWLPRGMAISSAKFVHSIPTSTSFVVCASLGGAPLTSAPLAGDFGGFRGVGLKSPWTIMGSLWFRRTSDAKHVEVVGSLRGGTTEVAFVLPAGWRPGGSRVVPAVNATTGTIVAVQVEGGTGEVKFTGAFSATDTLAVCATFPVG